MVLTWLSPRLLGGRLFFEYDNNTPTQVTLDWVTEEDTIIIKALYLRLVISREREREINAQRITQDSGDP